MVSGYFIRDAIQELPDPRILTAAYLVCRPDRQNLAMPQHAHAVSNQKGTSQFVGDDNDGHLEGALEIEDQ